MLAGLFLNLYLTVMLSGAINIIPIWKWPNKNGYCFMVETGDRSYMESDI